MIVVKRALGEECGLNQNAPSHLFLVRIETTLKTDNKDPRISFTQKAKRK